VRHPVGSLSDDAAGLITYVKSDRYVHTLNTASGMRRKLTAMNIGVHLLPPVIDPSAPLSEATERKESAV